jgi:hypothetical protein
MTLKEKLKKEGFSNVDYLSDLAEEFAIGFAEWIINSNYRYNYGIKMYEHIRKEIYKSKKELLEMYKKEKGL